MTYRMGTLQEMIPEEDYAIIVRDVLESLRLEWVEINEWLRGLFGVGVAADELALLFHDRNVLSSFLQVAVHEEGYELFNSASDYVNVHPLGSTYRTEYWFARTPHPYRLELMELTQEGSPLHEYLLRESRRVYLPIPVHASFKCPTEEAYADAVHALRRDGLEVVQQCRSSYGAFSYWQSPTFGGTRERRFYIKPRVNLRDVPEAPGE